MFKRILCLILSCCLMLSVMAIPVVAEGAAVSATGASGYRGETVEITVSLAGCENSKTLGILLDFDDTVLEYLGDGYSEWLVSGMLPVFDAANKTAAFASSDLIDVNTDICKLAFTISETAPIENIEIGYTVTAKTGSTVNAEVSGVATVEVLCNHIGGYENDYDDHCEICGETRVICTPTMTVAGDLKADVTDKISLTVSIADCVVNGNSVVANSLGLTYQYDTSVLELVEDECTWLVDSPLCSFDGANSTSALAADTDFDPNTQLCTLVFSVLEGAAMGDTSVNCTLKIMNGSYTLAVPAASATANVTDVHTYDDAYDLDCNDEGCVHDRAISGFTITSLPEKLEYRMNTEALDVTGGTLKIAYDDNTTQDTDMLPEQVSGFDNTVLGKALLTVTVANFTQTFEIEITVIRGDVDGDEDVDGDDAIRVLLYSIYPELYEVNQDCDFNGDGEETGDDAIQLLYYSLYPELYPIS